jgi:hypothetical protein
MYTWTEYTSKKRFKKEATLISGATASASAACFASQLLPPPISETSPLVAAQPFFARSRGLGRRTHPKSERSRIRALSCSSGPGREKMCKGQLLLLLLLCAAVSIIASANTNQQDGKFLFL